MALKISKKQTSSDASPEIAGAVKMGIESAPEALIVEALTNMYSTPLSSAIRETVSNAIDASREAATKLPVIVTLDKDILSVLDAGCGMDEKEVTEVFLQYGASSKSKNIDATGAFGFGAKSPLAYNGEMVVSTIKDGVGVEASISNKSGAPYAQVGTKDVQLPAGYATKIVFPIKRDDYIEAEAAIAELVSYASAFGDVAIECDLNDEGARGRMRRLSRAEEILSRTVDKVLLCEVEAEKPDGSIVFLPVYAVIRNDSEPEWMFRLLVSAWEKFVSGDVVGARHCLCRGASPAFAINGALYYFDGTNQTPNSCPPSIIVPVPSAALSFVPSREAIILDEKSNAVIGAVMNEIEKAITDPVKLASIATNLADVDGVNPFCVAQAVVSRSISKKASDTQPVAWVEALGDIVDCSEFKVLSVPVEKFDASQKVLFFNVDHRYSGELKNAGVLVAPSAKSFSRHSMDALQTTTTFDGFDDFNSCAEAWGAPALTAMMELKGTLFSRFQQPRFVILDSSAIPPKKLRYEIKKVDARIFEQEHPKSKGTIVNIIADDIEQVESWLKKALSKSVMVKNELDNMVVSVSTERYLQIKAQEKAELALLRAAAKKKEAEGRNTSKIARDFEAFIKASEIARKGENGGFVEFHAGFRARNNADSTRGEKFAEAIMGGKVLVVEAPSHYGYRVAQSVTLPLMLDALGALPDTIEYVVLAPKKNCTVSRVKTLIKNNCLVYDAPNRESKAQEREKNGLPVLAGLGIDSAGELFLRRGFCQEFEEYCEKLAKAAFVKKNSREDWRNSSVNTYVADCYALTFGTVDFYTDEFSFEDTHPAFSLFNKSDGEKNRVLAFSDELEDMKNKTTAAALIWDTCFSKYGMRNEPIASGDRLRKNLSAEELKKLAEKKMELGKMIGAKVVFDAYLAGVSLDDLMETIG